MSHLRPESEVGEYTNVVDNNPFGSSNKDELNDYCLIVLTSSDEGAGKTSPGAHEIASQNKTLV